MENTIILLNESGFQSGYACINQLLYTTHEIYRSFDDSWGKDLVKSIHYFIQHVGWKVG